LQLRVGREKPLEIMNIRLKFRIPGASVTRPAASFGTLSVKVSNWPGRSAGLPDGNDNALVSEVRYAARIEMAATLSNRAAPFGLRN
jgi:hypothetical protein